MDLSYSLIFQFAHKANWMLTTQNITVTVEFPLRIITEWPKRPSKNNVNNKIPYIHYCAIMVMKKLQISVHRRCCQEAAPSVHYTTTCKHSLVLLRMGEIIARNTLSWLKTLIKVLLFHLVGCLYYYGPVSFLDTKERHGAACDGFRK